MLCRHCKSPLSLGLADLGTSPPSNSYVTAEALSAPEKWYPLKVFVCESCWLAQTADFVDRAECFSTNYAYFSSCSTTWLDHAASYAREMISRYGLGSSSLVVEVASNDGYLLRNFVEAEIPCYGIEPTVSTASAARTLGIEVVTEFFGVDLARRLRSERGEANLIAANNVLAHVPDINDFAGGVARLLAPGGVATFEFPHLMRLIEHCYFDTIYHEHFSYLSLHAVRTIFAKVGLFVFDVEELETHGGSLRVFAGLAGDGRTPTSAVEDFLGRERACGLLGENAYREFQRRVERIKDEFVLFLVQSKREGLRVAGYGAAAKGNTLLNFAGVKTDLLPFVVDRSPGKIGRFLPGSRIPILPEDELRSARPDIVLLLPWNLKAEISQQLAYVKEWGGRFAVALPEMRVFS